MAGAVGRYFGDGAGWAAGLPIPALLRWHGVMARMIRMANDG